MRYLLISTLFLVSCANTGRTAADRESDREKVRSELSGEMSLKADREELAALRKNIPEEKKKSNDELALILNLMKQGSERPEMVRDKFTVLAEKKRSAFRDKVQKLRESYRKSETKRREEYLEAQKKKRADYLGTKRKPDEMREFFADQDKDRQSFFSDERDRRSSFESELNASSKDFDSYMHEKMNEFNEQFRLYSKAYTEKPKAKNAVTGDANKSKPVDFKTMDQAPAKQLGTDD